jgi:hypothetical protein
MDETRQCQCHRANRAPDCFIGFENCYGSACLGNRNGCGEPVRTGADHNGIIFI